MKRIYFVTLFTLCGCNLDPNALFGGKTWQGDDSYAYSSPSSSATPVSSCRKDAYADATGQSDCDTKSYWSRSYEDFVWGFTSSADNKVRILFKPSYTGKDGELISLSYIDILGKRRPLTCTKESAGIYECLLPWQSTDIEDAKFFFESMYVRRGGCLANITAKIYPTSCQLPAGPDGLNVHDTEGKKLPVLTPVKDTSRNFIDDLSEEANAIGNDDSPLDSDGIGIRN